MENLSPTPDVSSDEAAQPRDDDEEAPYLWGILGLVMVMVVGVIVFRGVGGAEAVPLNEDATTVTTSIVVTTTTVDPETLGVVDRMRVDDRLTAFVALIDANGLEDRLGGDGPFTIFAPTNAALEANPIPDDPADVRRILFRHVVSGAFDGGDDFTDIEQLVMLDGSSLEVGTADGGVTIDDFEVGDQLVAANGFVHVLDGVLAPPLPTLDELVTADEDSFTTLRVALDASGLVDDLVGENLVLLAPTDAAFGALPDGLVTTLAEDTDRLAALLAHHVLVGPVDDDGSYETLAGDTVVVEGDRYGEATLAGSERNAVDGAMLVPIDAVLVPDGFVLGDVNDIIDLAPVTFQPTSAELTDQGQAQLDRAIEYLLQNPVNVEIGGHTDSSGDEAPNQTLSEQRAQTVFDYLVAGGVDAEFLTAVGYGESRPVADNETDEGRALNRRIEFTILG